MSPDVFLIRLNTFIMYHLRLLFSFLLVLGISATTPLKAQEGFGIPGLDGVGIPGMSGEASLPETKGTLSAQTDGYKPGETFPLILHITHAKGWHSYYENPGSVGFPADAKLQAPEGFDVKGPFWSIPHVGKVGDDLYYGGATPSFLWLVTPTDKAQGKATFTATGSWQLCGDEGCLEPSPEASYSVSLEPNASATAIPDVDIPLPEKESSITKGWKFSVEKSASPGKPAEYLLHITIPSDNPLSTPEKFYFFSQTGEVLPTETQKLIADKTNYTLVLPVNDEKNSFYPVLKKTDKLIGMLTFSIQGKEQGVLLDLPLSKAVAGQSIPPQTNETPATTEAEVPHVSLMQILIGLFLGGLILNLMPCVFPVIGLKVMSFVQMGGGERRKVVLHSLSFVIGVLISFWIITTLLAILKLSIPDINWAFWLENPWVIFILLLLMLGMGLSMFGVFEIGVSATSVGGAAQSKKGYSGSFYSGILATVVATPCSAPFLGASIGPAMALPTPLMYLAFTGMGLGMALPYLILGMFPSLTRFLPRPGAWMESFKQGLSFLLFATAVWLLWTYWAFFPESDPLAALTMLLGLVLFAFATWIKGRWDLPYKSKRAQWIARLLTITLLLSALYMARPRTFEASEGTETPSGKTSAHDLSWNKWTLATQEQAIKEGRPVYIDFTARWCATCQVNKSVAYSAAVQKIFREHNVLLLKADKTTTNPEIDAELKKLGRSAVPVNVLYIPGENTPYITQPLLSASYLEAFLQEHLAKRK